MRRLQLPASALHVAMYAIAASMAVIASAGAEPFEDNPQVARRDPDYAAGKQAMETQDWPEAASRFKRAALRDPDNPDLQNYLGYTHRKLGLFALAFDYYKHAIRLSPRHRGAHEYIGEGYLMTGNLASAEKHLSALRDICLLPCEELGDLEKAVAEFRGRQNALSR